MNGNPNETAQTPVADAPKKVKDAPIKGVVIGLIIDIGGTLVFGIIVSVLYGVVLIASGVQPEALHAAMQVFNRPECWQFWVSTISGCVFSVLGGYVCARIAKNAANRAGLALAVISTAFGFLFINVVTMPKWLYLLLVVAGFACVLLGSALGRPSSAKLVRPV